MKYLMMVLALAVVMFSPVAMADCGTGDCAVGAYGIGGLSSDGMAQGFYYVQPGTIRPEVTFQNSGNPDAGRLNITEGGTVLGTTSGTFRRGTIRGRASGVLGDFTGQCDPFIDPDCGF